jgi:hypothetical protein
MGVRHLLAVCDLGCDRVYGHVKTGKCRREFPTFCHYLPACIRLGSASRSRCIAVRQMLQQQIMPARHDQRSREIVNSANVAG